MLKLRDLKCIMMAYSVIFSINCSILDTGHSGHHSSHNPRTNTDILTKAMRLLHNYVCALCTRNVQSLCVAIESIPSMKHSQNGFRRLNWISSDKKGDTNLAIGIGLFREQESVDQSLG